MKPISLGLFAGLVICLFVVLLPRLVFAQDVERGTRVFIIEEDVFETSKLTQIFASGGASRENILIFSANDGTLFQDSPDQIAELASKGARSKPPIQMPSPERLVEVSVAATERSLRYVKENSADALGSAQQKELRRIQYVVALAHLDVPPNVSTEDEAIACARSIARSSPDDYENLGFDETFLHVEVGNDSNISQGLPKLVVASLGHFTDGQSVKVQLFDPQCPEQTRTVQFDLPKTVPECKQEAGLSGGKSYSEIKNSTFVNKLECVSPVQPTAVLKKPTIDPVTALPLKGTYDPSSASFEVSVDGLANTLGSSPALSTTGTNWTLVLYSLDAGRHTIKAVSTDNNGNQQMAVLDVTIAAAKTPVVKPPTVKPVKPPKFNLLSQVRGPPYIITGTSDLKDGCSLRIEFDGKVYEPDKSAELKVDDQGNWTLSLEQRLAKGEYALTAICLDSKGKSLNETTDTLNVEAEDLPEATANITNGNTEFNMFSPRSDDQPRSVLFAKILTASQHTSAVFLEEEVNGNGPILRTSAFDRGTNLNFDPALKRKLSVELSVSKECQLGQMAWVAVLLQGRWSKAGVYKVGGVITDCSLPIVVTVSTMEQKQ